MKILQVKLTDIRTKETWNKEMTESQFTEMMVKRNHVCPTTVDVEVIKAREL